jgi:hypothetical protein
LTDARVDQPQRLPPTAMTGSSLMLTQVDGEIDTVDCCCVKGTTFDSP